MCPVRIKPFLYCSLKLCYVFYGCIKDPVQYPIRYRELTYNNKYTIPLYSQGKLRKLFIRQLFGDKIGRREIAIEELGKVWLFRQEKVYCKEKNACILLHFS